MASLKISSKQIDALAIEICRKLKPAMDKKQEEFTEKKRKEWETIIKGLKIPHICAWDLIESFDLDVKVLSKLLSFEVTYCGDITAAKYNSPELLVDHLISHHRYSFLKDYNLVLPNSKRIADMILVETIDCDDIKKITANVTAEITKQFIS